MLLQGTHPADRGMQREGEKKSVGKQQFCSVQNTTEDDCANQLQRKLASKLRHGL